MTLPSRRAHLRVVPPSHTPHEPLIPTRPAWLGRGDLPLQMRTVACGHGPTKALWPAAIVPRPPSLCPYSYFTLARISVNTPPSPSQFLPLIPHAYRVGTNAQRRIARINAIARHSILPPPRIRGLYSIYSFRRCQSGTPPNRHENCWQCINARGREFSESQQDRWER